MELQVTLLSPREHIKENTRRFISLYSSYFLKKMHIEFYNCIFVYTIDFLLQLLSLSLSLTHTHTHTHTRARAPIPILTLYMHLLCIAYCSALNFLFPQNALQRACSITKSRTVSKSDMWARLLSELNQPLPIVHKLKLFVHTPSLVASFDHDSVMHVSVTGYDELS